MTFFIEKLHAAQIANRSWVCVGLDPDIERMPGPLLKYDEPFLPFLKAIIDATADLVCAYKPNLGFYLGLGAAGVIALERTIAYIPDEIPIILDGKFNDIGHTASAYAEGAFGAFGADAVTTNPYLGEDSIRPFLTRSENAAFVLARTSNKSASDFQDLGVELGLPLSDDGSNDPTLLYQIVVHQARMWNERFAGTCGLVVGATYPQELAQIRTLAPDLPFLIPGIGAQGGSLDAAVKYGPTRQELGPIINSSRGVLYASAGDDFAQAARVATDKLRQEISALRNASLNTSGT